MAKRSLIHYTPVYGCIATGIIYVGIGTIALLSFFKLRHGGADESSMLAILDDYIAGKIAIWLLLLGILCYIIWRLYEAITDPYDYGKDAKGITRRIGVALSSVADALIVWAAVRVLLGTSHFQTDGEPQEEQAMVRSLLQKDHGSWWVIALGAIYVATAFIQLWYGITRGYKERVNIERFAAAWRNSVHVLAWAGYLARGVILGIIGYFFIRAGITGNAQYVVNTDKAFDFIGDHIGHVWFIVVAIATVCYGAFMFVQGLVYDTDKDE